MKSDRILNVLQTCFSHSWGGLEIQALEVTRKLKQRGHRLSLACCRESRLEQEAEALDINLLPLNVTGYFHPVIVWKIARFVKQNKIDIIHCQLSKDIATIVPATKLSRRHLPIVLSKRVGSYVSKKDLFHRFTYSHVSRVLAISEVIRKNILDTTPAAPDRVMTLHDAVDTDLFCFNPVARSKVRDEFGFDEETVVIGFVGRFSPGKGHEELLEAARLLSERHRNIHFLIVGEASHGEERYAERIKSLAHSPGLAKLVTFAGYRKDIPDIMSAFDIFAFPSHAESFGVVLIEAMATERPVVSTNCDGVLDIVVDGETGIYVHPRNAQELASALERFIIDPALRETTGRAGRRRVEELFDQRKQMDEIEQVYYSLLNEL